MKVMLLIPPSKHARNVARDLIYGCWCKGKRIAGIQFPPISQLTVVTVLRNAGHEVNLFDAAALGKGISDVRDEIRKGYEILVTLTSTMTINEDSEVFEELKAACPDLKVVVYGAHPTFMPVQTLSRKSIDIAVQREPEWIIRELANAFAKKDDSWRNVKGIAFRDSGDKVKVNDPCSFIENLDELPIPDRASLPKNVEYFNPVVKRMPFTTMFTSRGCPGRCTYCSSPPFYGKSYRFQSPERVIKEMEEVSGLGYREVFFRDEIFTASRERLFAICDEVIKRKLDLTWICSARVGSVDLEMMKKMKKAGCHMIRFGVESGDQGILNNIKKGITVEKTRQTFKWIHEAGLDTHAHLMIGMPGETKDSIDATMKLVLEIDPTIITCGMCTPYPGTPLFEEVILKHPEIEDGSACDLSMLHTNTFYNEMYTTLSERELSEGIRRLYRRFYLRPGYIFRWLKRIRSIDEFKRVTLAGMQVFDFSSGED